MPQCPDPDRAPHHAGASPSGGPPNWTSPATVASATAAKLGNGMTVADSANSRSHAVAACAPSRPA